MIYNASFQLDSITLHNGIEHTVFAEINAHPEISVHQKQWFSKGGGGSTQNRWLLMGFEIFSIASKNYAPGAFLSANTVLYVWLFCIGIIQNLMCYISSEVVTSQQLSALIYVLIFLISTPLRDIHQTNSGWWWNKNGNVFLVWWNIRTFKYLWFWNPKTHRLQITCSSHCRGCIPVILRLLSFKMFLFCRQNIMFFL